MDISWRGGIWTQETKDMWSTLFEINGLTIIQTDYLPKQWFNSIGWSDEGTVQIKFDFRSQKPNNY